MKKKLLIALLSIISTIYCVFAFTACNMGTELDVEKNEDNTLSEEGEADLSEYLNFELNSEHDAYIVKYIGGKGSSFKVVIPSEYNGMPVTTVGERAFYCCDRLTKITIPDCVTSIGEEAFSVCSRLTGIAIPDSVTSIGNYAFSSCSSLTNITIPDSVTSIGNYAFYNCSGLTSVTIPDSVTSLGNYVFYNCNNLTTVTLGSGVSNIGIAALWCCGGLTSIIIPDSVTTICDYSFYRCEALTDLYFGGTKAQWELIEKGNRWDFNTGNYTVHCTDGDIAE